MLSMDDKFTDPLREGNAIDTGKTFWGGIVVQVRYHKRYVINDKQRVGNEGLPLSRIR